MLIHRSPLEETRGQLAAACLIVFIAVTSAAAYGADQLSLIEFKDQGSIDWSAGIVTARGIGDSPTYSYQTGSRENTEQALTEALAKSRHNLLETIATSSEVTFN